MDGWKFDAMTRGLGRQTSRRRMLGGGVGGFLAVLIGAPALAARNKRKRGDKGEGGEGEVGATSALVGGIWENTLDVCQFDAEGGYKIVAVPMPSVPDYLDKGGYVYIDCCIDADCGWRPCAAPSGCIEGACMYDATPGVECNPGDGLSGVCNQKGECEALAPPPPVITEPIVTTEGITTTVEESFPTG